MASPKVDEAQFDAAYYKRFYTSKRTRVQGPAEVERLARGVMGLIGWVEFDVVSVLDVGAGPGLWRDWFAAEHPEVRYRSVDVSEYACKKYGHERKDIATWKAKERFDLVVCQGVLPYLDEDGASRAIENIAGMTRGFLYLEAATDRDLATTCDLSLTDPALIPRPGAWYRKRLERHYDFIGMGLWMIRRLGLPLYELEKGTSVPAP